MSWDKTPAQKEAVKTFLVSVDGKFDLEASCEKYRAVARQYIASQTAEQDLIGLCMGEVFDAHKGVTLNMDFIKSQTRLQMIKRHPELADPSLFNMVVSRIETYLHENCNQEAREATEKRPAREAITGKIYSAVMGRNAGFFRLSDRPVKIDQ